MSGHNILEDLGKADFYVGEVATGDVVVPPRGRGVSYYEIQTEAAETATLPDPLAVGQILVLHCTVYAVGDMVITAATVLNQADNTIMTFGAADDFVVLMAVMDGSGGFRWQIVSNDGVGLS